MAESQVGCDRFGEVRELAGQLYEHIEARAERAANERISSAGDKTWLEYLKWCRRDFQDTVIDLVKAAIKAGGADCASGPAPPVADEAG